MPSARKIAVIFLLSLLPCLALAEPAGSRLLAEGRLDEAVSSLQSTVSSDPTNAEAFNLLCRAYFNLSNWDQAISACARAVALDPGNSQYHMWLGRAYGEKADTSHFTSALSLARKLRAELETAVKLNPANADARTDLAEFDLEAPGILGGDLAKAEAQARALDRLEPAKADWVRGRIAEKKKDFDTAEKNYRAAIEASHGSGDAWFNLALFYRKTGRVNDMQDAIQKISAAPVIHPEILMEAADVLIRAGRDSSVATQLLQRYLSADSSSADPSSSAPSSGAALAFKAHFLLGKLLEQKNDKPAAAEQYRASLSLAHAYAPAKDALNRVNLQLASYRPHN
jgi:tetratricopeptide (TPR) repeat protein